MSRLLFNMTQMKGQTAPGSSAVYSMDKTENKLKQFSSYKQKIKPVTYYRKNNAHKYQKLIKILTLLYCNLVEVDKAVIEMYKCKTYLRITNQVKL